MNSLEKLGGWLSEEGVLTGARCVSHMEFDCNWRLPYRVVLQEWDGGEPTEFTGQGQTLNAALERALVSATEAAQTARSK